MKRASRKIDRLSLYLACLLAALGSATVGDGQVVFGGDHTLPPTVIIGNTGTGSLSITHGGALSDTSGTIGNFAGSIGTAVVDGAGSSWVNSMLSVGNSGTGSLAVTNGASVTSNNPFAEGGSSIGNNVGGTGSVTVDGTGTIWNIAVLFVGNSGAGTLAITHGGSVAGKQPFGALIVGSNAGGTGTVTVDGAGSSCTLLSDLSVGGSGAGSLTVTGGGSLSTKQGVGISQIGADAGGIGAVAVDGVGSSWGTLVLYVGDSGAGSLAITRGGSVSSADQSGSNGGGIGYNAGSTGNVTVDGAGSSWTNLGGTIVGNSGRGSLAVANGGTVSNNDPNSFSAIGAEAGGTGTVTVDGAGSSWTNAEGGLLVGVLGNGSLAITNGGAVATTGVDGYASIGDGAGGTGTVTVDGPGSSWANSGSLTVGRSGTGSLSITQGATVSSTFGIASSIVGDETGGIGAVRVDGAGSSWTTQLLDVGNLGTGTLSVTHGASVLTNFPFGPGIIGNQAGGTGSVAIDGAGSSWSSPGGVTVGYAGTGTLCVTNGGTVNLGDAGVITLGNLSTGAGTLNLGGTAAGPAAAGGVLNTATVTTGSGTGLVQFNTTGGASTPFYFTRDGTALGGAIAISGSTQLVNTGGYNVLDGASTYTGGTTIGGGTLVLGAGGSLQNDSTISNNSNFITAAGATVGGGGSYTQTGGSTEVDGSFTQGTLNIQGGSYTQTGSTTITGSATNAGTVLISANTFTAAGSFNNGGAVTIDAGATLDAGTYTQSEGSTLLNNGTLDPAAIMILGGTLGGTGMLVGNLSVAHAILHPGGVAGPGSLAIDGDFTQTGGKIIFDVYADGHGGFLESSLILNPGADFGVDNANIVFDFLGGADPLALFRSGEFGLDTFFLMSDGSSFSSDFDLSADLRGDTFSVSTAGYIITGFDPSDGSLQLAQTGSVPETNSTATLLAVGLGALTVARMRREGRDA